MVSSRTEHTPLLKEEGTSRTRASAPPPLLFAPSRGFPLEHVQRYGVHSVPRGLARASRVVSRSSTTPTNATSACDPADVSRHSSSRVAAPASSAGRAVRWAAAAAVGSLALFAAVSVGQMAPGAALWAHPGAALGASEDSLAAAESHRRTAAANEAESTQTARNMRDAKEMADAVLAEAEAEAERLAKLAAQKRKDFEIAKAETV